MTFIKNFQFWRPPTPLVYFWPNFFYPFDLRCPISKEPSPLPSNMITNELKDNIIQGWLLYVIRSFLQVDFHIHYQLINLVWFSCDFFSFSRSLTICFFVALCSCVRSCPKISRNVFFYNYSHFWYSFCIISDFCLHNLKT